MSTEDLVELRRELHRSPELSERETDTAARVADFLRGCSPARLETGLGAMGTGVLAVFDGASPGPTTVLRCELDALPLDESRLTSLAHRSTRPGVAHKCGHDGHMAVLCGVARSLAERPLAAGRAAVLFQPAEETGTGARAIVEDARFQALAPDFVFGSHNVPRHPLGAVLVRDGCFAAASVGVRVALEGESSHSSYPEFGTSPLPVLEGLIALWRELPERLRGQLRGPVLSAVTALRLGSEEVEGNFGIAPGGGLFGGILRASHDGDLALMKAATADFLRSAAPAAGLRWDLSFHEEFPSTHSGETSVALVREVASAAGLDVIELDEPFRWSEDFAYYTQRHEGAFFGFGAGAEHPQLHHGDYDFPDGLIEPGVRFYRALLDRLATPADAALDPTGSARAR